MLTPHTLRSGAARSRAAGAPSLGHPRSLSLPVAMARGADEVPLPPPEPCLPRTFRVLGLKSQNAPHTGTTGHPSATLPTPHTTSTVFGKSRDLFYPERLSA